MTQLQYGCYTKRDSKRMDHATKQTWPKIERRAIQLYFTCLILFQCSLIPFWITSDRSQCLVLIISYFAYES